MGPGVGAQRGGPVPKRMSDESVSVCVCLWLCNCLAGSQQHTFHPARWTGESQWQPNNNAWDKGKAKGKW